MMYKRFYIIILAFLALTLSAQGQNPVLIEMDGTNGGILFPRMSASQRLGIVDPPEGLLVYDLTNHGLYFHNGKSWNMFSFVVTSSSAGQPGFWGPTWAVFGNINAHLINDPPVFGNQDDNPIVFITNNIERMRISENGNITIEKNLDIFGKLTVDMETRLKSSLKVFGPTELNSTLLVKNMSPSEFTGTVLVSNTTESDSGAVATGALVVAGGVGIKKNINIGGNMAIAGRAAFGGPVSFASPVNMDALEQSTNTVTGALRVKGGVGIGKNVNIGENVNIGGTLTTTGVTTLNNTLNVNGSGDFIAHFVNSTDRNGISIQIDGTSENKNNYVEFRNGGGTVVGRIEGETIPEMKADTDYQYELRQRDFDLASSAIDAALATYDLVVAISNALQSVSSSTACVGLGACVTTPIPSWIVGATAQAIAAGVLEGFVIAKLVISASWRSDWITHKDNTNGITYQSGAGDYAEYLLRADENEKIAYSDIVGVTGGKISKNTRNADKMMVVSFRPIVLGNMPPKEMEGKYEKVAFMGQVPVNVYGKVNVGDYIIPSGYNNGIGVAISPLALKSQDIKNIVGIAWTPSKNENGLNIINVAVGTNVNDNAHIIQRLEEQVSFQADEIQGLKQQMSDVLKLLSNKNEGFVQTPIEFDAPFNTPKLSHIELSRSEQLAQDVNLVVPDESNILYYDITREHVAEGIKLLEKMIGDNGINAMNNEIWQRFYSDPSFKEEIISNVLTKLESSLAHIKEINIKR